jgi:WD40 repeat protein
MVPSPGRLGRPDRGGLRTGRRAHVSTANLKYREILMQSMRDLDAPGGSPQAIVEKLLAGQLWWKLCQEAVREDPGWLSGPSSDSVRRWLIATAENARDQTAASIRQAVDSTYLVSQALGGDLDGRKVAACLAGVAQRWAESGLLLPPQGTGLISASGRSATDADLVSGIDGIITVLSSQTGDLGEVREPGRAMVAMTALLLAGAKAFDQRMEKVAVVFGRTGDVADAHIAKDPGTAGFLELREFAVGPAGLFPDPRSMAGARAANREFADSLAIAWQYCGGNRCVLWRVIFPDDPTWIPVIDGGSLSAAFMLALLDLLRNRGPRRSAWDVTRRSIYRLRPATAVTGKIDDRGGLRKVSDIDAKLRAAYQKRWLLIAPEENKADLSQAPDPRLVRSAATIRQASRYAHQWRTRRLATASTLIAIAAATTLFALHATGETSRQRGITASQQLISESQHIGGTNPVLARLLAVAAWRLSAADPTAHHQAQLAMLDAAALPGIGFIDGHSGRINEVKFSPDDRILASVTNQGLIPKIQPWNIKTGKRIGAPLTPARGRDIQSVAFSSDGRVLVAASDTGVIQRWRVPIGQPIGTPFSPGPDCDIASLTFSPNIKAFACTPIPRSGGKIYIWDLLTHRLIGTPITPRGTWDSVIPMAFTPDGSILASGNYGDTVQAWNVATGRPIGHLITPGGLGFSSIAVSPDGKIIAAGALGSGTISLWDLATGRQIGSPGNYQPVGAPTTRLATEVGSVAFSPNGKTVASGGSDGSVRLWDTATGQETGPPITASLAGAVNSVAFNPDGKTIASGGDDGKIWFWNGAADQQISTSHPASTAPLTSVAFSPDGKLLATGGSEGTERGVIRFWSIAKGRAVGTPLTTDHSGAFTSVAFSPDGRFLVSGSQDDGVRLWNTAAGRITRTLLKGTPVEAALTGGPPEPVHSVAFSPDGRLVAATDRLGTIRIWNPANGEIIYRQASSGSDALSVAFSADSKLLAIGYDPGRIHILDIATRQMIRGPATDGSAVASIAFSPAGHILAIGYGDGGIQLWNFGTHSSFGTPIAAISTGAVNSLAFSPDGSILASGDGDGTTRLWDVATGQQIGTSLTAKPVASVDSVAFSPTGRILASGDDNGILRLWDVSNLTDVEAYLCRLAGRSLTQAEWAQYVPPGPGYQVVCPPTD